MKYLTLSFLCFSIFAQEQTEMELPTNQTGLKQEVKLSKIRFHGVGEYLTASNSLTGESYSGFGLGIFGHFATSNNWAFGLGLGQNFGAIGSTASVTKINATATYAVTGQLQKIQKKTFVDGKKILSSNDLSEGGFRVQLLGSQYYFNGTSTSSSFAGLGLSGFYEFNTSKSMNYLTGFRFEQLSNSTTTISPLSIFFGIGLWF